jgi:hypothetical protein
MALLLGPSVRIALFLTVCTSVVGPAAGVPAAQAVNPDAQTLADFNERVKGYLTLRDKVDGDAPPLKQTTNAADIAAAQNTLGALIRSARASSKQGDIFTPAIETKFRSLLKWETTGTDGAKAKAVILDEKPLVELKVNAEYPAKEPLTTVPPTVLLALPALPKGQGLEYRFVRKHMILLDTRANLIVDFVLNALS